MESVVTGQAPITLEWKITSGGKHIQYWYLVKQKIIHRITETNRIPQTKNEYLTKRGTPPKNLDKKGVRAFYRRRRSCPRSNRLKIEIFSVSRAPWAPNYPEFYLFLSVLRVNESDQKWGVTKHPFLGWYTPPSLPRLGRTLFWNDFTPFGTLRFGMPRTGSKTPPVGDCSSSLWLWHDGRLYVRRQTDQRPTPAQT